MKILFILDSIQKSLGIEWLTEGLLDKGFDLKFILINKGESEMESFLNRNNIPVTRLWIKSKIQLPLFFSKIYSQIYKFKPDAVHTHLRSANIWGITAAWIGGVKKRIYTRHFSDFNHLYHKKSVLLDKIVNSLSTDIIAISNVTKEVLINLENVPSSKITLIHHGFDLASFKDISNQRIDHVKIKHRIPDNKIVIGVIARYEELKGYQFMLPAFGELSKKYDNLHFILANTDGSYKSQVQRLLANHLPNSNFTEINFENDIQALYKVFDIFVHVPIEKNIEAFGQTYIEALAAEVPSVFTLSGVANEFISNKKNALTVRHKNSEEIFSAIESLISDDKLRKDLIRNGLNDVQIFNLNDFIEKSSAIYT